MGERAPGHARHNAISQSRTPPPATTSQGLALCQATWPVALTARRAAIPEPTAQPRNESESAITHGTRGASSRASASSWARSIADAGSVRVPGGRGAAAQ